jgi:hypothetical protein
MKQCGVPYSVVGHIPDRNSFVLAGRCQKSAVQGESHSNQRKRMTPKSQSQSRVWDRLGKRRHEVQRHDANQEQSRDRERDRGGRLADAFASATVESVVGLVIKGSVMTIDAISIQPRGAFHLSGRPFLKKSPRPEMMPCCNKLAR